MDVADESARAWFTLARAPALHVDQLRMARERLPLTALAGLPHRQLLALGIRPAAAEWLAAPDWRQVDADLRWAERHAITLVTFLEPAYPGLLVASDAAPIALWVRGDPAVLLEPQVAIVGSRRATPGGLRDAHGFARELASAGLIVTSGLALGIDGAAHEGALDAGGRSIAVCGTGLDQCYPRRHAALAARLARSGALVSEFPPGVPALANHFPRRNRIISALSMGVVVVEAAPGSGSLITAQLGLDQGRHIMAVPGSIHSRVSQGCHDLIREGATLVACAGHILQELKWTPQKSFPDQELVAEGEPASPVRRLDKASEMLLDALGFEPASIDELIARTGQQAQDIAVRLSLLELEGLVEALAGGLYGRNSHPAPRKVN